MNISVTEKAGKRIREILANDERGNAVAFKIDLKAGGCSGFEYAFSVDSPADTDEVVDYEGIRLAVSKESQERMEGTIIDCDEEIWGWKFVIKNPNALATCSCGKSAAF